MNIKRVSTVVTVIVAVAWSAPPGRAWAAANAVRAIPQNVPGFIRKSTPLGYTATGKTLDVTIWLKLHDRPSLDGLVADLYDPESAHYRHWITPAEFATRFAPTALEAATVGEFFKANGLTVVETGPENMYVRARGTVESVNRAFNLRLADFLYRGETVFANTSAPVITGAAGSLTAAVYGLHNLAYTHPLVTQTAQPRGSGATSASASVESRALAAATAPPISSACFSGSENETFETNGTTYPYATLHGNAYAIHAGAIGMCGYTPPEIQAAYNLGALYKQGFDGTGQTIVIIDWCGSPTIRADANAFSAAYGLPPLTAANFKILNSSGTPTCAAADPEINIDVEWAHAIAPGATIDLVVPPTANLQDVDNAEFYAVINRLGSVISGSYGSPEIDLSPAEVQTENLINEIASVQGIAANFSSGDGGDGTGGNPAFNPASVIAPADSPYATAVGGISLALKSGKTIEWQSGWGTNVTPIVSSGFVFDPPTESAFFDFGSGGGQSAVFAKPSFQKKLRGSGRLLPDISWLADPFTGAVIVISLPFQAPAQVYEVYGGTSLACPMFSALWAIANQEANVTLGQAAQYVYGMPSSTITDVKPVYSKTNVTATYRESASITDLYSAADLAGPLETAAPFVSAMWNIPLSADTTYVLTFGTDTSLATATGWDDVTGVGVPNGEAFVNYFKPPQ